MNDLESGNGHDKLCHLQKVLDVTPDVTSQKGHCCGNYDAGLIGNNVFKSQISVK